ncbi:MULTISPECIES: PhaM family polyhydroxyalkanoate granule multifunctional regulatory protein [Paraburkholderia]|uniref:PhaM family polyhydroxyalkanoate granule multifunctional regulatory protein n=1 Tax=Paraburkholderia TaxID=1822464 RepID=UPI001CAC94F4|nr:MULTISPECIES: PhaM family polyhydroxyalkanoate granule multifunctional regulatory protein [Paraburkholderia]BEU20094.1 transcriptional regulator [Paraburkholderia sp. 22B1P]GJG99261.1 transcriptional regulator [Paraburkholderia terrae]GJH34296.1 transcriptional regulator [Paraburkholderia hospita]CAG9254439.1 Alginate regulatory protein AlgP [Paraburkholderia caribensis]
MTDNPGATPPFPGFPGFPPAEMLDRMWGMMRLTPFGAAFPGTTPGSTQGFVPSLSMMSDMMAPLTNVEELDKRITDMRAVEQWLKLNLNMLQSAIQALEVQRATLATLRAFGAFAQQSMTQPAPEAPPRHEPQPAARAPEASEADESAASPAFDASGWWNLLQAQFNQIAQFAMAQPPATTATGASEAGAGIEPSDLEPDDAPEPDEGATQSKSGDSPPPAAKRPASTKRTGASSAKKTSSTSE